jgi:hypothetical protein
MRTHFTAWLVNDLSALDGNNCDVSVMADEAYIYAEDDEGIEEVTHWESTGEPIFQAVTDTDARTGDDEQAQREARKLLQDAGWEIVGDWEAVTTAYVVEVRRDADETWTLQEAAEHMGATSTGTASRALRRLGVTLAGRAPSRGGQAIYNAAEVIYAHATRPGRGARTDLDT